MIMPNYQNDLFFNTNESLEAIIEGMNPKLGEDILAVCGSGEQAYELAKSGANVLAVDNYMPQLEFACMNYTDKVSNENLNLEFEFGDVFDREDFSQKKFDSIYLSNALIYSIEVLKDEDYGKVNSKEKIYNFVKDSLEINFDRLKTGGKIYLADGLKALEFISEYDGVQVSKGFLKNYSMELDFDSMRKCLPLETMNSKRNSISKFEPAVLVKK